MADQFEPDMSRTFRSVAARLRSVARHYRVPAAECEDCAQEAILSLLRSHPDWNPDDPRALAWLRGATRNQALNDHRRQQRHPSQSIEDLASVLDCSPAKPAEPATDQHLRRHEIASEVHTLLGNLSEVNREILSRRIQWGLTFAEIGTALGLGPEQVKARYKRAVGSA